MTQLPTQPPKTPVSRRILQWAAVVPALFSTRVREWLVSSVQADREQRVAYQRYLNRK